VEPSHITILGGGPAGISTAYFAQKSKIPYTLYEANSRIGGNCTTFQYGNFLFDSGAHRFHDKDPEITREVREMLGEDLRTNTAQSRIYFNGKQFDFPLSPLNLLTKLGPIPFLKASIELVLARLRNLTDDPSFEDFALRTYGRTIASHFLLNYSEKLWGTSTTNLSPVIAGTRMKGLNLKTFIAETLKGKEAKTKHLDGSFLYPKYGIGMITETMAGACNADQIRKESRITRITHNHQLIKSVEVNKKETVPVDQIISTLPLSLVIRLLDPSPPDQVLELSRGLRFRGLILVAIFLNRDSVSNIATYYFPEPDVLFTRVYEPKVRSEEMSPPGKTSLVAEIPCDSMSEVWRLSDSELIARLIRSLPPFFRISKSEILGSQVIRIPNAYPILEKGYEKKIETLMQFLDQFSNLTIAGRNGLFNYTSVHDMIRSGKELIENHTHGSSTRRASSMIGSS
jgi:protoporphyrinogen oxidase